MKYFKSKYTAYSFIALILSSLALSGCAYYVKKTEGPNKEQIKPYGIKLKDKKEVIRGLVKNYGNFKGMSGRINLAVSGRYFSFKQAGLYTYIKNEYIKFVIPDMYGNILLYAKITKGGGRVTFLKAHGKGFESIYLNKKYSGRRLMYGRLFKIFKIFLNLNSLVKIKKSDIFYDTPVGFFFEYCKKLYNYYIYVDSEYLINKIAVVQIKNGKMLEYIVFKDYILKGGVKIPLKINIEDYLYNVKIKIVVSKGSNVFYVNNFNGDMYEK